MKKKEKNNNNKAVAVRAATRKCVHPPLFVLRPTACDWHQSPEEHKSLTVTTSSLSRRVLYKRLQHPNNDEENQKCWATALCGALRSSEKRA
jgi:hypothetical protein